MAILKRATFTTSRLLEFYNRKELTLQTGHEPEVSPLVILKELVNNALDSCGEATRAPVLSIEVEPDAIVVSDNGAGLPVATLDDILDFSVRVSSREAYVAPDRGQQGNALKTVLAMPFVLDGEGGARGDRGARRSARSDVPRQSDPAGAGRAPHDVGLKSKKRHSDHSLLAAVSLLIPDRHQAAFFTNGRGLHVAQPASQP